MPQSILNSSAIMGNFGSRENHSSQIHKAGSNNPLASGRSNSIITHYRVQMAPEGLEMLISQRRKRQTEVQLQIL